jgi:maleylpyruvate isomerase
VPRLDRSPALAPGVLRPLTVASEHLVPEEDLRRVDDAHRRFLAAIVALTDLDVRRPSLLPGWSIGHVLTHVARNADSHRRRTEAAARGALVDQYPGGYAGRAAEIEEGAGRTADELVDDVGASGASMDAAWRATAAAAWAVASRDVGGVQRALSALPSRRWQELEVHLVDLDIGVTHRDWPDDFVAVWLPRLRSTLPARLAEGSGRPAPRVLDDRDELAWLYGRLVRPDLPSLAPWG